MTQLGEKKHRHIPPEKIKESGLNFWKATQPKYHLLSGPEITTRIDKRKSDVQNEVVGFPIKNRILHINYHCVMSEAERYGFDLERITSMENTSAEYLQYLDKVKTDLVTKKAKNDQVCSDIGSETSYIDSKYGHTLNSKAEDFGNSDIGPNSNDKRLLGKER